MKKENSILIAILIPAFLMMLNGALYCHETCDASLTQPDKLIVKPENYNITVKDKTEFKMFLQNNMDDAIAEISLIAESPAFDFHITPDKMPIPKHEMVYFKVTMLRKPGIQTGNYPINFRLVGGGRQLKSFGLNILGAEDKGIRKKVPSVSKAGKAEGYPSVFKVMKTERRPEFNAWIKSSVWKSASVMSNFTSEAGGDAENQTIVLTMHDNRFLYLEIYCYENAISSISVRDCVDVRIAADPSGFPGYSFSFPAVGTPLIKKCISAEKSVPMKLYGLQYLISSDNASWGMEVAIPFSLLDDIVPSETHVKYYMRINRVKNAGNQEKSFWAADSSGYNKKDGFGEFVLAP